MTGYDVIGDVHGHADAPTALLGRLGYCERGGAWRHAGRTAVFVGDLRDRGPGQVEAVGMSHRMVKAGSARIVMGIMSSTRSPEPLRTGTVAGTGLTTTGTSDNMPGSSLRSALAPRCTPSSSAGPERSHCWLALDGLRVADACGDPASMAALGNSTLAEEHVAAEVGSAVYDAIDVVLKGPEIEMNVVEGVLGFPLPPSSRRHLPHWYGYDNTAVGRAIRDAGWRGRNVGLTSETLTFEREP